MGYPQAGRLKSVSSGLRPGDGLRRPAFHPSNLPELRSGGGHLGQQDIPAGQVAPSPENERSEFRGRAGEGVNGHAMLMRLPDYFVNVHQLRVFC